MTTETEVPVRLCDHGIHQAKDWVVISEGVIAARAVTRDEAKLEALPGDSIRLQPDPDPCGSDARDATHFVLVTEGGWGITGLCAKHIRLHHEDAEAGVPEGTYWVAVDGAGSCAVCSRAVG